MPVTLNWKNDNEHRTRCGGAISILGLILVGSFIVGTCLTYFQYDQIRQQTLENYVDTPLNKDCSATNNECQQISSVNYMPFTMIADNN